MFYYSLAEAEAEMAKAENENNWKNKLRTTSDGKELSMASERK